MFKEIQRTSKPKIKKLFCEYTHKDMVNYIAWFIKTAIETRWRYPLVLKEFVQLGSSTPDVIAFRDHHSLMIECKRSYQDFKNDFKKESHRTNRCCGNLKYYFFNTEYLAKKCKPEVPENWGIFFTDDIGQLCIGKDAVFEEGSPDERIILLSVIRRLMTKQQIDKYLEPNDE
jgi:hypothetical protein